MSRMCNKAIVLDKQVKLEISDREISVTGPKGTLSFAYPAGISFEQGDGVLHVRRAEADNRNLKMKHGMVRSLVNSMVVGVTQGFKRELELSGIGYRGQVAGQKLTLNLGYSLPVEYEVPANVKISMPDPIHITLEGIDKQAVGQVAAIIRGFRAPDAYHGKGVRYAGEKLTLKEGKKVGN